MYMSLIAMWVWWPNRWSPFPFFLQTLYTICTDTVQTPYRHRTDTDKTPYRHCTDTVQKPYRHCTDTVQTTYRRCTDKRVWDVSYWVHQGSDRICWGSSRGLLRSIGGSSGFVMGHPGSTRGPSGTHPGSVTVHQRSWFKQPSKKRHVFIFSVFFRFCLWI
jgi:hypothetical protein